MRSFFQVLAVVCALAAGGAAQAQALFAPPEGDFSVAFPKPPTAQARPAKRMNDVAVRRYVDQEPARAFVVALELYPQGSLPPSPNGAVYDRLLRTHAEDSSSELVSTRAARLAGRPSLEGTFKDADGNVEIVRLLMLADCIYRLSYARAADLEDPGAADAFFASFKLPAH